MGLEGTLYSAYVGIILVASLAFRLGVGVGVKHEDDDDDDDGDDHDYELGAAKMRFKSMYRLYNTSHNLR